jgi:hypothetical protein
MALYRAVACLFYCIAIDCMRLLLFVKRGRGITLLLLVHHCVCAKAWGAGARLSVGVWGDASPSVCVCLHAFH